MKLNNFKRLDPNAPGEGLERGGKLEEEIWNEYYNRKEELFVIAEFITNLVQENKFSDF